jgi:hypothetical protein
VDIIRGLYVAMYRGVNMEHLYINNMNNFIEALKLDSEIMKKISSIFQKFNDKFSEINTFEFRKYERQVERARRRSQQNNINSRK